MFTQEINIIFFIFQKLKSVGPVQQKIKLPYPHRKKLFFLFYIVLVSWFPG